MTNKNGVFYFILNQVARLTGGEPWLNSALCRKNLPIPELDYYVSSQIREWHFCDAMD